MDAKELHDQHEIQTLLDAIRSGLRPNWGDPIQVGIIERALSLLAAVEDGDEIVRELRERESQYRKCAIDRGIANLVGRGYIHEADLDAKAAARITLDAQEKAALNRHISALREALYGVTEDRSAIKAELAEVTKGYNTLALMFQEKRNENALQRQQLKAALEKLAAMKRLAEDANRDIFWLYTHCRAIGMVKEADKTAEWPRAIIRDICMFTIDLLQRAEAAEQQKRKD